MIFEICKNLAEIKMSLTLNNSYRKLMDYYGQ